MHFFFLKHFAHVFTGVQRPDCRVKVDSMATAIASPAQVVGKRDAKLQRKSITWSSLAVGAAMNIFQVSTLGQPLENIKTYVSLCCAVRHKTNFSSTDKSGVGQPQRNVEGSSQRHPGPWPDQRLLSGALSMGMQPVKAQFCEYRCADKVRLSLKPLPKELS